MYMFTQHIQLMSFDNIKFIDKPMSLNDEFHLHMYINVCSPNYIVTINQSQTYFVNDQHILHWTGNHQAQLMFPFNIEVGQT